MRAFLYQATGVGLVLYANYPGGTPARWLAQENNTARTPLRELPIVLTGLEREMALNIKIENKPN